MDWRQLRAIYFCAVAQVDPTAGTDARLELGPPARPFLDQLIAERGAAYGLDADTDLDGRKLAELLGVEGEAFCASLLRRARATSSVEARTGWVRERAAHNLAARRVALRRLATRIPEDDPVQAALAAADVALGADGLALATQPIADVARTLARHHEVLGALELRVDLACDRRGVPPPPRLHHDGAALGDLVQLAEIVRAAVREDDAIASARHPYTRWLVRRAAERPGESLRADMTLRQHERDPPELERVLAAMAATPEGHAILVARPPRSIAVQAFHGMLADTVGGREIVAMLRRALGRGADAGGAARERRADSGR